MQFLVFLIEDLVSHPFYQSVKCPHICQYICVCVMMHSAHAPCGLAAAAAWPESRLLVQCLWECGEFGWDQLIKHWTLALSCFPCRQGSSDRWGSHTGSQRQKLLFTAAFFFSPTHAQLTQGVRTFSCWPLCYSLSVTSFTSPEKRRMKLKLFLLHVTWCNNWNVISWFYASAVWFCNLPWVHFSNGQDLLLKWLQHEILVQDC